MIGMCCPTRKGLKYGLETHDVLMKDNESLKENAIFLPCIHAETQEYLTTKNIYQVAYYRSKVPIQVKLRRIEKR